MKKVNFNTVISEELKEFFKAAGNGNATQGLRYMREFLMEREHCLREFNDWRMDKLLEEMPGDASASKFRMGK